MTTRTATLRKLPIESVNWESLIPAIGRANRALARYEGIVSALPNPGLLLSPLTTREAVLSSKIEGTQASMSDVLRSEAGMEPDRESRKQDIQEIQNYRRALQEAERALKKKPFGLNMLRQLHAVLMKSVRGQHSAAGEFRRIQNWIGRPGATMERATYVPPGPDRLMEYLDNWEKYYHSDRPDPLVQLAVVHAQFELIHPFLDGNGRMGRLVIPLFLAEKGLLSTPMFYLSEWFESHRDEYYKRLQSLSGDELSWNGWIDYFLNAVEGQATKNVATAQKILALYENLKGRILELTRSQWGVPILDAMFKRPVFTSSSLPLSAPKPTRAGLANILRALKDARMIEVMHEGSGRRPTVFAFAELINLTEGRKVL